MSELTDKANLLSEAKILAENFQWTDAIQCYDQVLKMNPNDSEVLYLKAYALSRSSKPKEALKYLDKFLILFPDHVDVLCEKGLVLDQLGLRQEAMTLFDKALKINPQHVNSLLHISRILLEKRSTTENSFRFLKSALSIEPTNRFGLSLLREHAVYLRDLDEVFTIVENALKADPKNFEAMTTAKFLVSLKNSKNS